MLKCLAAATAILAVTLPLALFFLVAVAADPGQALTDIAGAPTVLTLSTIPPAYLTLYMQAARTCPGLPWSVLAGIGTVESDNGRSHAPGVHSGTNSAGAEGPMQFLPATFRQYAIDAERTAHGAHPPGRLRTLGSGDQRTTHITTSDRADRSPSR